MKPPSDEKSGGDGAGGRERHTTSHSQFNNWWRKKHRQVRMADDFTSSHDNPAMMNIGTVNENTLGGSGARAVPQSTQEKSVVGPLMGVFEDLIKSSTPQLPLATSHPMGVKSGGSVRTKKTRSSDTDSSRAPKRRKGKTSTDDQRWSKRFTWPDEVSKLARFSIF